MSDVFIPIRLYIKECNGVKYFGKTVREDVESYSGSGVFFKKLVEKYGYQNTLWVSKWYHSAEEVSKFAVRFSKLNKIVESEEWANLMIEDGLSGGDVSASPNYKESMQNRRSYKGEGNPNYGKVGYYRNKVGCNKGKSWFNNGYEEINCLECPNGYVKGRLKKRCPHCDKSVDPLNTKWHFDYCKHNANRKIKESHLKGLKWWNNGEVEVKSKTQPIGFERGRIDSGRFKNKSYTAA